MEPAAKRPKLAEAGKAARQGDSGKSGGSGLSKQPLMTSIFKKAAPNSEKEKQVQEALRELMEIDEADLMDCSGIVVSQVVEVPKPAAEVPYRNPMVPSATLRGLGAPERAMEAQKPKTSGVAVNRVVERDADEQRALDKRIKQKEKNTTKYSFLENPLDGMRRDRSDPNYDESTLHIPANVYYNMTDFERQYWDIKSKYFNYVVFFQKGKFYELMEGDADIAALELGTAPMDRSGMKGTGVVVESGEAMAQKLVSRGYSVVFVCQTESPLDRRSSGLDSSFSPFNASTSTSSSTSSPNKSRQSRTNDSSSMDVDDVSVIRKGKRSAPDGEKMLRRVVDRILTPGTTIELDEKSGRSNFLLSLVMSTVSSSMVSSSVITFGVCLLNVSSGSFVIGELQEEPDTENFSKLRSLLFFTRPREILYLKSMLPKTVMRLLKLHSGENAVMRAKVENKSQPAQRYISQLKSEVAGPNEFPAISAIRKSELLQSSVALMGNFLEETKQEDWFLRASWVTLEKFCRSNTGASMVLDGKTLENLCLVEDEDRQIKKSVFGLLDKTSTPFGHRLLFQWFCHPLQSSYQIERRLQTVDFLIANQTEFTADLHALLSQLAKLDLEKLLSKALSASTLSSASISFLPLKSFIPLLQALQLISSHYQSCWSVQALKASKMLDLIPPTLLTLISSFDGSLTSKTASQTKPSHSLFDDEDQSTMNVGNPGPNDGNMDFQVPNYVQAITSELTMRSLMFPDIEMEATAHQELEKLKTFVDFESFNSDQSIMPSASISETYDRAIEKLGALEEQFQDCLSDVRRFYEEKGVGSTQIMGNTSLHEGKDSARSIEISTTLIKANGVPNFLKPVAAAARKGNAAFQRYTTNKIEQVLTLEWQEAKLMKERGISHVLHLLTRRFASCIDIWWRPWVQAIAELDCLLSLSISSQIAPELQKRPILCSLPSEVISRPNSDTSISSYESSLIEQVSRPFIAISQSVHPLLAMEVGTSILSSTTHRYDLNAESQTGNDFSSAFKSVVSNDILMGDLPESLKGSFECFDQSLNSSISNNGVDQTQMSDQESKNHFQARSVLLTGPNMGGKSTLLRQVCIAVIMAQVGCYPFGGLAMTSCDRIFTRIGASDNIFEGRSTFMVELEEAASMLNYATERSLVVCDELGRGTSTFDGYSIAYATLHHLTLHNQAHTLFSTHYHFLTREIQEDESFRKLISLKHMNALVNPALHTVTFLYKLAEGVCPQSYGMMVAAMAEIPLELVKNARLRSFSFQTTHLAMPLRSPSLKSNFLSLSKLIQSLTQALFSSKLEISH
jgi:DNA mismatch repair ATPase MutS